MNEKYLFFTGCILSLAALTLGSMIGLASGGALPYWLLPLALMLLLSAALFFGFTGAWRQLIPWLKCRSIAGTALIFLGVILVWVPVTFVLAAIAIGVGCRLLWIAAGQLESSEKAAVHIRPAARPTECVRRDGPASAPERMKTEKEVRHA